MTLLYIWTRLWQHKNMWNHIKIMAPLSSYIGLLCDEINQWRWRRRWLKETWTDISVEVIWILCMLDCYLINILWTIQFFRKPSVSIWPAKPFPVFYLVPEKTIGSELIILKTDKSICNRYHPRYRALRLGQKPKTAKYKYFVDASENLSLNISWPPGHRR